MTTLNIEKHRAKRAELGLTCRYSAAHALRGVPATTTIDCGPVGTVSACQDCADFYERNSK